MGSLLPAPPEPPRDAVLPSRRHVLTAGLAATIVPLDASARAETAPIQLVARAGRHRLMPEPAEETAVLGFDGRVPGPVLRVRRGESVRARFENFAGGDSSVHWYGLHGANTMDGAVGLTQPAVPDGGSRDIAFIPAMAGTHWFHPLASATCAGQLDRGLCGMLVVEESAPPPVDREIAIFLDDWRLGPDGRPVEPFNDVLDAARSGRLGGLLTVNGRAEAEEMRLPPRSRVRIRLVNVSNARIMPMRFERVGAATVIALDGQPTEPFDPLRKQVILGPGGRFDVLVDLPEENGKDCALLFALGPGVPLLRMIADGEPVEKRPPVRALESNGLPFAVTLQNAERPVFEITGGVEAPAPGSSPLTPAAIRERFPDSARVWQINGGRNAGFSGPPLARVKTGRPVVLTIANKTAWAQVIHTHGHHFRYLHPFDDGWEPYWLDTLVVAARQTIRIAFNAEAPGRWAVRSSILEHFASGVASWFEVT